ncbi:SRPBCC domain-containing protein [uncultured Sphingomonas sp.]|uniref:SRPBCC family protein n=1 Tax=uncultured Sphingomonas sp. TaxID=158754 RepID=UPI0035CC524B
MSLSQDWTPQYCEDATYIPASPDQVFDALLDIDGWNDWWVMMRFEPEAAGALVPGSRVVFDGGVSRWIAEVLRIDRPRSIRFRYAEGDLLGETEWRITPEPGGCRAAYVYHGVTANANRAAATFGTFGTKLHMMVMEKDALDGLVRKVTGAPLDAAWRDSVRAAVAVGRAALVTEIGA